MNEKQKETLVAWLRDAHAMEEGLVTILEKQVKETAHMPDIQIRVEDHLEETREHAQKIADCLAKYDAEPSGGKDFLSKVSATIGGMGMTMMEDSLVKNIHSSYAAEQFEIVTYTLLRSAAEELGDMDTAAVCDEIIVDEDAMAEWLIAKLPTVVVKHVQQNVGT
jgi:ferritin-like metal-binding protein YciE